MNCIFCKIIAGEIPSYTLYEDDIVISFLDIHPDTNGHLLIIPKKHILNLDDMDNTTLEHIMNIARKMKTQLEQKLHIDGVTLIQNNGDVQEIKHFHLHLKPYYKEEQPQKSVEEIYQILKEHNA